MTAIGATAVVVTAVRNDLKLWTIINIGSTIILWWSLFQLITSHFVISAVEGVDDEVPGACMSREGRHDTGEKCSCNNVKRAPKSSKMFCLYQNPKQVLNKFKQGSSENDGRSDVYDRSDFKVISNCCYQSPNLPYSKGVGSPVAALPIWWAS